jgi:hypothetical protein
MGEAAYMLGASVALVLGMERWLLAVLAPSVLGSALFLLLGRPPVIEHLVWAMLAATPALALVLAAVATRRTGPSADPLLTSVEVRAALPAIAFGLISAALLTFPIVSGSDGHGGINRGALVATVPLSLSMGAAEWSMLWYRRRSRNVLNTVREPSQFSRSARLTLLAAVLYYLAWVVVLTAVGAVVMAALTAFVSPDWAFIMQVAAYVTLGVAMFLALLLQSFRLRAGPLIAGALVLAMEIALHDLGVGIQLAGATVLFAVLGACAAVTLSKAVRHA